ncbi:uncharacterized protein K460DRAFT_197881 [Cucurbitaria berberidis CBS 394.84]|uniref:Uncharacterized protein n=1 Tax=Cucurbitaria berberidis CBS 394.84 TaxID=1168544 RepID=A0A9P4G8M2_9PLEO|nr:uncharacterized protein K460DRAFT_197881 [Cucurbitaria berberidis CBS 394.84]KAF1841067.1 hypothetical protein K460DRAFT_197881 [Cucurbitaria berberidis CBS 394.84]
MSYNVYLVEGIGAPRNHHSIIIEKNPDGSGYIFQVTGDVQRGMEFGHKNTNVPEESASFASRKQIGTMLITDFDRIQSIVESIEPPAKQFNGPKRINPREPLRRCQEWTADAIQALKNEGVLRT